MLSNIFRIITAIGVIGGLWFGIQGIRSMLEPKLEVIVECSTWDNPRSVNITLATVKDSSNCIANVPSKLKKIQDDPKISEIPAMSKVKNLCTITVQSTGNIFSEGIEVYIPGAIVVDVKKDGEDSIEHPKEHLYRAYIELGNLKAPKKFHIMAWTDEPLPIDVVKGVVVCSNGGEHKKYTKKILMHQQRQK